MPAAQRLIAILLAAAVISADARAADAPATMLVIDGSGSMWGPLPPDRRAKIDVIREHLTPLLAAVTGARLGITSYGHRRRGDCRDAETIASVNAPREAANEALAKLDPRGKGPLVAGLTAAIADIGQTRPASVLLITDGADNCQQDACAAAMGFAATAPGVAIHVVAAGVPAPDMPRLACIARATGGGLFEANDPAGLTTAIDAAAKLAMLTPDAVVATPKPAEPGAPAPTGPATLRAALALADGGGAVTAPARWRIFQAGAKTPLAESDGAELTVRLDAGSYDIEAQVGRISARQTISVEAGEQQSVSMALNAARLVVKASNAKGGPASASAAISIAPDGADAGAASSSIVTHAGGADVIVPPATYKVTIADGLMVGTEVVALAAGDAKSIDVVLDAGRLELTANGADGALLSDIAYKIETDDPESPNGRRDVARSRAPQANFTLPAGTYYVEAASGAGAVSERVAVGAGETVVRALSLALVRVTISAEIAGAPARADQGLVYRVAALDGDQREVARSLRPVVETALLPGRYRIAAHLDAHHITAEREVLIEAGKPATIVIAIAAAEVQLKGPVGFGEMYWEISDSSGNPVWRTLVGEPKALLAPGRYTVRYENRDRRLDAAFEVKAGERRTIEIGSAVR